MLQQQLNYYTIQSKQKTKNRKKELYINSAKKTETHNLIT